MINTKVKLLWYFFLSCMKFMIKYIKHIAILLFLHLVFSFDGQAQTLTDLKYFGLKGKVKKQVTTYYTNIIEDSGEWYIKDSNSNYSITRTFDKEGLLSETIQKGINTDNRRIYTIKNSRKTENFFYSKGKQTNYSKYIYTDSSMIEKEYTLNGKLSMKISSFFDKNLIVTSEEIKNYKEDQTLDSDIKTFFENDSDGFSTRFIKLDMLTRKEDVYTLNLIKRDETGNSIKALKLINNNPYAIQITSYEYYY